MTRPIRLAAAGLLLHAALPIVSHAAAQPSARSVTLRTADLDCISLNLAAYLDAEQDPLIIVPGQCPDPAARLNSVHIPGRNGPKLTTTPKITILEKREIACIVQSYRRLPPARRKQEAITWNLARCTGK